MSIYGIIIGIGLIIGIDLIKKNLKTISYKDIFIILLTTFLGARVLFLLHNIPEIQQGIVNPLFIWQGGLAFYGGLCGLLLALLVISRKREIPFLKLSDQFLLFVPLIHSIGRVGNYFNQELYGKPTSLPWGINIPKEYRVTEYLQYDTYHPVFLYEAILNLINFILLLTLSKRIKKKGLITGIYFLNYSIIRLAMNRVRIDKEFLLGIETSDLFSVLFFVSGILILSHIMKKNLFLAKFVSKFLIIILLISSPLLTTLKLLLPAQTTLILFSFTFLIPLLVSVLFKYLKLTSDFVVNKREERPKLLSVFLLSFLFALYISINISNPILIEIYTILCLTFLFGILLTLFWKVSFHMIISTLAIFYIIFVTQQPYTLLLALLLPLIGWSRIYLKRHNLKQVVGGFLLTIFCIFVVLTLNKFW